MKGGAGGRGTWGSLLETGGNFCVDCKDPNHNSEEELVSATVSLPLEDYDAKVFQIVEEYFTTDNIVETAADLHELGSSMYHHHFVKKLVCMSLDRHDREKEMAAVLLSALYADVIEPGQLIKGFTILVKSADGLAIETPYAVDILAHFVARAVVDDILAPSFLSKVVQTLPEGALGHEVMKKVEQSYLDAEIVQQRWGGCTHSTVEEMRKRMTVLLNEYVVSGDGVAARRCIRELNVPFFYHELVKKALMIAIERRHLEGRILALLKEADDGRVITSTQMAKGFARLSDGVEDLSRGIPQAQGIFLGLVSKAIEAGFLSPSSANSLKINEVPTVRKTAASIIQAYFLTGDILEAMQSLVGVDASEDLNALFVKQLILSAMEYRNDREKEMASVLLSCVFGEAITTADVVEGFVMLLEAAEATALNIPNAETPLSQFLARAVVDDVLEPMQLDVMWVILTPDSLGVDIVNMAQAALAVYHEGDISVLGFCGGGPLEDAKDEIKRLLEKYEDGGHLHVALCRILDLMPFFHHELVKQALVMEMETTEKDRLLNLLRQCAYGSVISEKQMNKGFTRVGRSLNDLESNIEDAISMFESFVKKAKSEEWLFDFEFESSDNTFSFGFDPKLFSP